MCGPPALLKQQQTEAAGGCRQEPGGRTASRRGQGHGLGRQEQELTKEQELVKEQELIKEQEQAKEETIRGE